MIQLAPPVYVPVQHGFDTPQTSPRGEILYFADFAKDVEVSRVLSPLAEAYEILPVTFSYTIGNESVTCNGYRVANDNEVRYFDRDTMTVFAITGPENDAPRVSYSHNPNVPMPFLNAEKSCRLPYSREQQKAA